MKDFQERLIHEREAIANEFPRIANNRLGYGGFQKPHAEFYVRAMPGLLSFVEEWKARTYRIDECLLMVSWQNCADLLWLVIRVRLAGRATGHVDRALDFREELCRICDTVLPLDVPPPVFSSASIAQRLDMRIDELLARLPHTKTDGLAALLVLRAMELRKEFA